MDEHPESVNDVNLTRLESAEVPYPAMKIETKKRRAKEGPIRTIRQQMIVLLKERDLGARELSQAIGIREKQVYEHLPHVARSAGAQKSRLLIRPFRCLACGFLFQDRKRFTRPSRCPHCKSSRLEDPIYRIA
jgi:predicted Zn-ribbon and HTH transcriptional regulator